MQDELSNLAPGFGRLQARLAAIVGAANVHADHARIALHSTDIWGAGSCEVVAVVSPATLNELSRTMAAIDAAGYRTAPRGAGMSYTAGYIAEQPRTVSLVS
jgi:D-lactate dehydrogenase (cytochrome)